MGSMQSISASRFPPARRSGWPRCRLGPASRSISLSAPEAAHADRSHEVRIRDFGCAWRLLAPSRLPPIHRRTPSAPRYRLPCFGCLKQMPNPLFQQFDGLLQGAELSNAHYGDRHAQLKRWGAQHFNLVERIVPGNKSRWQQPESISCLNERQLKMHVVYFSSNHRGEAGTLHPIDEVCPKEAPRRIEHPWGSA